MPTGRRRAGNASGPKPGDQGAQGKDTSKSRSHSIPPSEKDPSSHQLQQEHYHAKSNNIGDNDNDKSSDSFDQSTQFPTKQDPGTQATTTPLSFTPPTTPLAQAKSMLTVVTPSAVKPGRPRKRAGQRDDPIDISMRQTHIETASPRRGGWVELLNNTVKTLLEIVRNPFFVPLCFVITLWCLISSFRASLAEVVYTAQSAGTAIGYCVSFTWQYAGAWMQSVWNTATSPVHQILLIGADVTIIATNKTAVAVCSHYFGWLILTNLGLSCPFSVPYQPLDGIVTGTLTNSTIGLSQIVDIAVELLPHGRQLIWSELWLRQISFTVLESDITDKVALSGYCGTYSNQIYATGRDLRFFASGTDSHLVFQKYNLKFLQVQIQNDNERSWWLRLFYPKEAYIRNEYIRFIEEADNDLLQLLNAGNLCVDLIHQCQETNGHIHQILHRNRNDISEKVDKRGILSRWLGRNEDLSRKTSTIINMEGSLGSVLDLLGSILDKVAEVRAELSTLSTALGRGHVGATSPYLMVQMQIIETGMKRLEDARDRFREGKQKEDDHHKQQFEEKTLIYRPVHQP